MCCQDTNTLSLPAPVIETLAQYRRLLDERGWDWGDEQIDLFRWTRFTKFGAVFAEYAATGDWAQAIRSVIDADVPVGVVVVRVDESGALRADVGPALIAVAGRAVEILGEIQDAGHRVFRHRQRVAQAARRRHRDVAAP